MKFIAGNCYNIIPILQVCHIWFKIGRYQQCLFVSTNCAIVQKTTECGVVHFLPSEAVIIGASLRAAKWGRQKTGEEVGRWTGGAFMEILTETVHHGTAAQAN